MPYITVEQRDSLIKTLTREAFLLRQRVATGHSEAPDTLSVDPVQLRRVQETLHRLRSPEFGICEDCGGEIAYELLKNDPFAKHCLPCQHRISLAPFVPNEL